MLKRVLDILLTTKMVKSLNFYVASKNECIAYRRDFDETKYKSFLIKDDELLENYNEIWERICNRIKKGFDSEPAFNEKYLKTKIKSYGEKPTQILTVIKYQKNILNLFVHR